MIKLQLLLGLSGSLLALMTCQFQSVLSWQLWSNQVFLPITAGIFVYISTVHVIPEVIGSNDGMKGTVFKVNAFLISILCVNHLIKYKSMFFL